MSSRCPVVVVVPGILGSALRDGDPVGPRPVWGHLFPSLDRLAVHPEEPWREPWPARVPTPRLLEEVRDHRRRLESLDLALAGLDEVDWPCIAGVAEVTRTRLRIAGTPGGPGSTWRRAAQRLPGRRPGGPAGGGEPWQTGDGTVPYEGTRPAFLPSERLVAVTRDDSGYWELLDGGLTWGGVRLRGRCADRLRSQRRTAWIRSAAGGAAAEFRLRPGGRDGITVAALVADTAQIAATLTTIALVIARL